MTFPSFPMNKPPPLILASRSRARQHMLRQVGLVFECIPADLDEDELLRGHKGDFASAAQMLAQQKALFVSQQHPLALVIGADSVQVFEGQLLQKAKDKTQALGRLKSMQGRAHQLTSAVAVVQDGKILWEHADSVTLGMATLSADFLKAYGAAADEDLTACAGGYSLEAIGAWLFEKVEGDFFTVLGMPLLPLLSYLRMQHGYGP